MTGPGILPALAGNAVAVDSVTPWPGNPRKGDIELIAQSLSLTGQYRPLIVQAGTGRIMAGNQTWHAARSLGWNTIAAVFHDVDDEVGRRIVAIDNRASDLGAYDDALLAELLTGLEDLSGTGYSPDDLDDLLSSLSVEAAAVVLDEVPATDAAYAETPEAEQARRERIEGWTPRYAQGLAELILIYPDQQRTLVLADIGALRERLGPDATSGDAVAAACGAALTLLDGDCAAALATLAPS